MAITVRELVTELGFKTDTKSLDQFNNKINLTKKRLEDLAEKSIKIGRNLTLGLTLPIAGLSAFAIKAASDAEEINSKFNTIFKDLREESDKTAKQLSRDFGLSGTKARELIGNTGDLLTGFGFTQESALDLSKQVNELAVDLASFTNFSGGAEGASAALTKALLGERESVKSLGISILEEDVKKQIAINTAKGLTFETERQAKAFATLQLAQQQSRNAIGDFARTSASFANRMRIFRARLQDVGETFGNIILPPATDLLNRVITLLEAFSELSDGTKRFILIMAGMAAVVGPIFLAFGLFSSALLKISAAYQLVTKSVIAFRAAMISANIAAFAIPIAIAAAVAAVFLIIEDLIQFFRGNKSVTGVIVQSFKDIVPKIAGVFESIVSIIQTNIEKIKPAFMLLTDIMVTPFILVKDAIMSVFGLINNLLNSQSFSSLILGPSRLLNTASGLLKKISNKKNVDFNELAEPAIQKVVQVREGVEPAINKVSSSILEQAPNIAKLQNFPSNALQNTAPSVSSNTNNRSQVFNIKLDAPIQVDQSTSPADIGVSIQQGLELGLERVLRQTARANAPALEF